MKKLICVTQHEGGKLFRISTRKSWEAIKKELAKNRHKLVFNPIVEKIDNNAWHIAETLVGKEGFFSFMKYNGVRIRVHAVFHFEDGVLVNIFDSTRGDRVAWKNEASEWAFDNFLPYESIYE